MTVNYELYKVFYYAASYLNFSQAGKKLFISQSAVSQAIKQLENQLGLTLFFRQKKKIALTPQGEDLLAYVEKAFLLLEAGQRNLADNKNMQEKELKIAASDTICKYHLLPSFKNFTLNNPKSRLKIINRPSPQCLELLEKGSVDLAAVNLPEEKINPPFEGKIIGHSSDLFIAGKSYKELENKRLSLKDLSQLPLLLLERSSSSRRFLEKIFAQNQVDLEAEIEIESIDLLLELTKIGLGISFVPEEAVQNEKESGNIFIIDLDLKIPQRSLALLHNRELPLSKNAENFMNLF